MSRLVVGNVGFCVNVLRLSAGVSTRCDAPEKINQRASQIRLRATLYQGGRVGLVIETQYARSWYCIDPLVCEEYHENRGAMSKMNMGGSQTVVIAFSQNHCGKWQCVTTRASLWKTAAMCTRP